MQKLSYHDFILINYFMEKLIKCKFNKFFVINNIDESLSLSLKRRLFDLGFTKGQKIKILKKSLLGKTYLLQIRDYTLSMRDYLVNALWVD